ncbi:MAG: hypothetical protein WCO89_03285, partial [Syntrophus sp. (in: bacteria)]
ISPFWSRSTPLIVEHLAILTGIQPFSPKLMPITSMVILNTPGTITFRHDALEKEARRRGLPEKRFKIPT